MNNTKQYAYVRVSTKEQNEDRQMLALAPYKLSKRNIYMDKQSGKDFNRPAYKRLMKRLRPGDLLIVKSIDRLGRNYEEIIEQWRVLTKEKKIDIKVIDMPLLDTTYGKDLLGTFISDLVLQVLSFTAQNERDNIRQRQAEGIAAAHAKGIRWGNTPMRLPDNFEDIYSRWQAGELTQEEVMERCGMARSTFYKYLRQFREAKKENCGNNR